MSETAGTGTEFVFVYTTLPDVESAEEMAQALVESRLAACANIYPGVISVYEWQGEVERAEEVAMFIKTRRAIAEETIAEARKLHPYDVPAFLLLPIDGGHADYLDWARRQVKL